MSIAKKLGIEYVLLLDVRLLQGPYFPCDWP